jgi:hypothetical protein
MDGASAGETPAIEVGFSGTVYWVEINIGAAAEAEDHQISPGMMYRIAMSRQ